MGKINHQLWWYIIICGLTLWAPLQKNKLKFQVWNIILLSGRPYFPCVHIVTLCFPSIWYTIWKMASSPANSWYTEVRDAWSPLHNTTVAPRPVTLALVDHSQDVWADANMEPVLCWLEDTLKNRRRAIPSPWNYTWYHTYLQVPYPIFLNVGSWLCALGASGEKIV